jgi:hypothetical protein
MMIPAREVYLADKFALSLLAESASHSAVFFSYNNSANSTFYHGLSAE